VPYVRRQGRKARGCSRRREGRGMSFGVARLGSIGSDVLVRPSNAGNYGSATLQLTWRWLTPDRTPLSLVSAHTTHRFVCYLPFQHFTRRKKPAKAPNCLQPLRQTCQRGRLCVPLGPRCCFRAGAAHINAQEQCLGEEP